MKNFLKVLSVLVLGAGALPWVCSANVSTVSSLFKSSSTPRVHITQGHVRPDPVAFVPLLKKAGASEKMATQFFDVIRQDLCGCGSFIEIRSAAFIQKSADLVDKGPRMEDWRLVKARFLIYGSISSEMGGSKISIKAYDVNAGTALLTFSVMVNDSTWRRAAHMAADQIYSRITGEKGMFDSQLVYIESMPVQKIKGEKITHLRRLKMMDQDGANDIALTKGDNLVLTPRHSPDGKMVAYLAYKNVGSGKNKRPTAHVYLLDLITKRQRPLLMQAHFDAISQANGGAVVNMTYAPRFSADGHSICFALIIDGKSAIYTMNLVEGKIRRLTNHIAIDTSPDFSKDGRKIVFTSNRSGKEKIYLMNADGTNVQRVTGGEGKYSQPTFSPRGDFIAFSKQVGNQFFIGVIRPNGQEERLILQSYLAEGPSWSPNGRYVIFTRQSGPRSLRKMCMVDLTGFFMREMNTKRDACDCSWSPLLKY